MKPIEQDFYADYRRERIAEMQADGWVKLASWLGAFLFSIACWFGAFWLITKLVHSVGRILAGAWGLL